MVWYFWPQACEILVHQWGVEPTRPALQVKVLTTRPPGKSFTIFLNICYKYTY